MSDQPTQTTPVNPEPVKPGYKTTEFWLSTIATVAGLVMAAGILPEGGMVTQIVGGVIAALSQLGYTGSRTSAKKTTTNGNPPSAS